MTTDEKLQHFYDIAVGEAKTEASDLLEAHRQELDAQFEYHKQQKQRELELLMKEETDNLSREMNKTLSASQLEIKRKWSRKQNELKNQLFSEIQEMLKAFMASAAYDDYLEQKIKEAIDFAGEDALTVSLAPSDAARAEVLSQKTGITLEIAREDFMGGIKAMIPSKNILIDSSFSSAFQAEKKNFTFDGGLSYE